MSILPPSLPANAHLVRAKAVRLLVSLYSKPVVEQEAVVTFLAVAVVNLRPAPDSVQRRDRETAPVVVVGPLRFSRAARQESGRRHDIGDSKQNHNTIMSSAI